MNNKKPEVHHTLIPLAEYALSHNITPATMRQRIKRGLHPEAIKPARDWMIPADAEYRPDTYHKEKKEPRD